MTKMTKITIIIKMTKMAKITNTENMGGVERISEGGEKDGGWGWGEGWRGAGGKKVYGRFRI